MVETVAELHSGIRWILVVLALIMLVRLGQGVMSRGKLKYGRLERLGMMVLHWLFRIQWLVGILYIILLGNLFNSEFGYRWEHLIVMTLGLGVFELQRAKFPGIKDGQKYRHGFAALLVVSILVFVGVLRIPAGWSI